MSPGATRCNPRVAIHHAWFLLFRSGCLSALTCLAGAWSRLLPSLLLGRACVLVFWRARLFEGSAERGCKSRLFQKGPLRARRTENAPWFKSSRKRVGGGKKHSRLFSFSSLRARAEQKTRLLWFQPGGGEKHSCLSPFSFMRARRT